MSEAALNLYGLLSGDTTEASDHLPVVTDFRVSITSPTPTPTSTPDICINDGDVDNNGSLTPQDAQMVFFIYLQIIPDPTEEELCSADCNGDTEVTPADALCIFEYYLTGSCECVDPVI